MNIGDRVSKGQLIGKATKFGAANIHASIGGTVQDIVTTKDTQDNDVTYVVIETDTPEETGERDRILNTNDYHKGFVDISSISKEDIITSMKEGGLIDWVVRGSRPM